jgi:hypothetical protein
MTPKTQMTPYRPAPSPILPDAEKAHLRRELDAIQRSLDSLIRASKEVQDAVP